MTSSRNNTEEQVPTTVEEPTVAYGHPASRETMPPMNEHPVSQPGRMTPEEYFNEVWRMTLRKRGNLQG